MPSSKVRSHPTASKVWKWIRNASARSPWQAAPERPRRTGSAKVPQRAESHPSAKEPSCWWWKQPFGICMRYPAARWAMPDNTKKMTATLSRPIPMAAVAYASAPRATKRRRAAMRELLHLWSDCLTQRLTHPFIALAAFNLDFLFTHPFRDGQWPLPRDCCCSSRAIMQEWECREIYQPGTPDRREQRVVLRNPRIHCSRRDGTKARMIPGRTSTTSFSSSRRHTLSLSGVSEKRLSRRGPKLPYLLTRLIECLGAFKASRNCNLNVREWAST